WGTGFIATKYLQQNGMPSAMLLMFRMLFAALAILLVSFKKIRSMTKLQLRHGIIAGLFMGAGFLLQTIGMQYTLVSNNAFLTTLNVIFVPFISWLLLKKRPPLKTFISVAIGFLGIAILTKAFDAEIAFNLGDILSLLCSVLFACQIAYIGFAAKDSEASSFSFVQISVTGVMALVYFLLFEQVSTGKISQFGLCIWITVYLGVACTAIPYWLECTAQQHIPASRSALILSLEGMFASIFSVILGYETLSLSLVLGGAIIMASIILLEINFRKKRLLAQ
ncbi:MAG: DMT family transporter, partial [Christensenella sp.]|uniref:DMT family transporter n=1 Tax=Christensenella sp. TaxID=1935934 RepID=UPI002B1EBCAD